MEQATYILHGKAHDYKIQEEDLDWIFPFWVWDELDPTIVMECETTQDKIDYATKIFATFGGLTKANYDAIDRIGSLYLEEANADDYNN